MGVVLGSLVETLCVYEGIWHYPKPQILGFPIWVPIGYGLFGVLVVEVSNWVICGIKVQKITGGKMGKDFHSI